MSYISAQSMDSLEELVGKGVLDVGTVVILQRSFYFKGVEQALAARENGWEGSATFYIRAKDFFGRRVEGRIRPTHVCHGSSGSRLSGPGQRPMFMCARIAGASADTIALDPIAIGDKILRKAK